MFGLTIRIHSCLSCGKSFIYLLFFVFILLLFFWKFVAKVSCWAVNVQNNSRVEILQNDGRIIWPTALFLLDEIAICGIEWYLLKTTALGNSLSSSPKICSCYRSSRDDLKRNEKLVPKRPFHYPKYYGTCLQSPPNFCFWAFLPGRTPFVNSRNRLWQMQLCLCQRLTGCANYRWLEVRHHPSLGTRTLPWKPCSCGGLSHKI